jgi:hypothetical protein
MAKNNIYMLQQFLLTTEYAVATDRSLKGDGDDHKPCTIYLVFCFPPPPPPLAYVNPPKVRVSSEYCHVL